MFWYYANEGKRVGPVDDAEFQALVETGVILAETLVWNETLPRWLRHDEVREGMRQSVAPQIVPAMTCCECGQAFQRDEMIRYGETWVCANCKPIFVQKLKEGAELPGQALAYAGFWIRFGAKFIDGVIQAVAGMALTFLVSFGLTPLLGRASNLGLLLYILLNVLNIALGAAYNTYFLGKYGATPGKMMFGLQVVLADGSQISYSRAVGRYFAEWLNSLTLGIGYMMAGFDEQKRALHDHVCNTRVIRKRA